MRNPSRNGWEELVLRFLFCVVFFFQKNFFLHIYRLLLCVSFLHQSTLTSNRSRRLKRFWYKILIMLKVESPCIYQRFLLAAIIRIRIYANE